MTATTKENIVEIKKLEVSRGFFEEYSGFEVVTSKQSIKLLIDNRQQCCEQWGYFWCNDDPQSFIGAELLSVNITDDALNQAQMKVHDLDSNKKWFEGGVMFVNLKTNKGILQFVAYNEHNGYYSHRAKVECEQLMYHVEL